MRNFFPLILALILCCCSVYDVSADNSLLFKGRWGKEADQLGINFPSPGVMPLAPYQCIGGYDVDETGGFWFSDSVNHMLKCYKDKKWTYIMVNFDQMGDLVVADKKIYVVTRKPDGIAVVNIESGKVERQIRIAFKNPGRLRIFNDKLMAVEESGAGLWICKDDKPYQHPAVALEAAGTASRIFGLQYNFEEESRAVISAEFADEIQEPSMYALFEAGEKIIFSKTAGMKDDKPVIMVITNSQPEILKFMVINDKQEISSKVELKILDGPFLISSWKLCSDGNLYGFGGDAKEGFRFFKADKNL